MARHSRKPARRALHGRSSRRAHSATPFVLRFAVVAVVASVLVALLSGVALAAFAGGTSGGPMRITSATLSAPTSLSSSAVCTSAGATGVTLDWSDAQSVVGGYSILRSTSPSGPFSSAGTTGAGTTTYTDSPVTSPSAGDLYVAMSDPNGMDVLSTTTGTEAAKSSAGPSTAIAVTPDGSTALLARPSANAVVAVALSSDKASKPIGVGFDAAAIAITPDGSTAWIAGQNHVRSLNLATMALGPELKVGFEATAIAIAPDGSTAWLAGQGHVRPLSLASQSFGQTLAPPGTQANFTSIRIAPDGATAYLTDVAGHELWSLTLATRSWGSPVPLGFAPAAVAITANGTTAWVDGGDLVVPVTLPSGTLGNAVTESGATFAGIAISPNGCWVYAADRSPANRIVPINTVTDTAAAGIPTDPRPYDIATAIPPTAYSYEVEATRDLWTSPPSAASAVTFGQPAQSSY